MNKAKYMIAYMLIICITLAACGGSTNSDAPKQDAVAAETAETAEGVTAPPASDGTVASHDPTQEERREEMQKADSEDAPMPYQSDPDTEQEGRREEVQKADEERWQEEAEDEPGEGEWHDIGDGFYTHLRLEDFLKPYPNREGVSYLNLGELMSAIFGPELVHPQLDENNVMGSYVSVRTYSSRHDETLTAGFVVEGDLSRSAPTYNSGIECNNIAFPGEVTIIIEEDGTGFSDELANILIYVLEQTKDNPRNNIGDELGLSPDEYTWYHMVY